MQEDIEGRTFGDFMVAEKLGHGGFGTVYRARQQVLDRPAVIKVLHHRLRATGSAVDRFLREARLASRLDHPYAAHIYAFGAESDGILWLAMELVRGTTLSEYVATNGPIPIERFVPLLERICEVVHTAHEQGIVHRDIKSANVMVVSRAGRLLPKLLDFGIAKVVFDTQRATSSPAAGSTIHLATTLSDPGHEDTFDAGAGETAQTGARHERPRSEPRHSDGVALTQHGALIGSPHYMAPEQWVDAKNVDARTDLYALGVLAYEALTGTPPFTGRTVEDLARAHAAGRIAPVPDHLPRTLDVTFKKALARNREDRYANALELAAAFRAAANLSDDSAPLPQLDDEVRSRYLAEAPQPVAQAVAALDAARHPRQARDAMWSCTGVLARYLGVVALAARSRMGAARDTTAIAAAVRRLGTEVPADEDWPAIVQALVRPHAENPDLHAVPELVLFCFNASGEVGDGVRLFRELFALRGELADAAATDQAMRERLARALAILSSLLRAAQFVVDYTLVVPIAAGTAQRWTGARRSHRPTMSITSAPTPGTPILVDQDGVPVLALAPLLQILPPAPGAEPEAFLYAGRGERGGKLVAPPFERHDEAVVEWLRDQLSTTFDEVEAPSIEERAPYRGLEAFTADDAANFFGREELVDAFVNRLRVQPMLAVVGRSGSGKSSFVQAGVIPALADWRSIVMRPGSSPVATLCARLAASGIDVARDVADPAQLGEVLRREGASRPILVVVDQLEELITLTRDDGERARFVAMLTALARDVDDPVRVIVTLRDDFLVRVEAIPGLRDHLTQGLQLLGMPARDDLERILVEPARRAGYEFDDPELVERMVAEVVDQPGALALLSFTASRMWEHRDRHFHRLRRAAYEALGGVGGALAHHAEELLEAMTREDQRLVRETFRHLVTSEGTRAVLTRGELASLLGGGAGATAVIERLVSSRLLVASEGDVDEQIEIAHEALLVAWPRLVEWRQEDAEGARVRDQLRAAARQWESRGRPNALLWRDDVLADLERWRTRRAPALTDSERAFADASTADARRGRRIRRGLLLLAIASLTAGIVVLWVFNARARTARARAEASAIETRRHLAEEYFEEGRLSFLAGNTSQTIVSLARAIDLGVDGPGLRLLLGLAIKSHDVEHVTLIGHTGRIIDARFSGDGRFVATAGDQSIRVWDAKTGRRRFTFDMASPAQQTAIVGARIIGSSRSGIRLWDLDTGAEVRAIDEPSHRFLVVAGDGTYFVAPAGDKVGVWSAATGETIAKLEEAQPRTCAIGADKTIVTGNADGSVSVWSDHVPKPRLRFEAHPGQRIRAVALTADTIATAAEDGVLATWRRTDGAPLHRIDAHSSLIAELALSPDGRTLATFGHDGTAKIWDVAGGKLVATMSSPEAHLHDGAFNPAGTRIATVGTDGNVAIWDASTGVRVASFAGHSSHAFRVAFDATGSRILSASFDGTAKVWNAQVEGARKVEHSAEHGTTVARIAPSGDILASGSGDGRVLVVAIDDQRVLATLQVGDEVRDLAFLDDMIVTGTGGGTIRLWKRSGELVRTVGVHEGLASLDVHEDRRILSAGADGARIWDAETGREIAAVRTGGPLNHASFDPTGQRIATAGIDRLARVFDVATGRETLVLEGPPGPVQSIELSRDRIVTSHDDGTAFIWDAVTGRRLGSLYGHTSYLWHATFSPDGALVATFGFDRTVRIWDARRFRALAILWHPRPLYRGAFSAEGRSLVVPSDDGFVYLWQLPQDTHSRAELDELIRCLPRPFNPPCK